MLESLLKDLITQGREASLVAYLLVTLIVMALSFYREWVVLGKAYKRLDADCEVKTKALSDVNEKLVAQRILNERATVALEASKDRIKDLEVDLARAEGRRWRKEGQTR